jgi:peroxiredoxin
MKSPLSQPKVKKYLPFLIILIAVVGVLEWQKGGGSLPEPQVRLIAPEQRSAEDTEFTLPDLNGTPRQLSDFRGKVVLLNFFATWCPPCRDEMPSLDQLFQTYRNRDFVVLAVAGDTKGQEVVEPFVEKYELTFPVVLDAEGAVADQYQVRGIPAIFLFDQQGKVAGTTVGGADWNSEAAHALIERLLQES